ncbi:hypothetical protein Micbo1qcDRAFT_164956 [Microdochium bolleyi]|uniref:Tetraspanin Tsp3 n=1 Tax=Microdochium bolleyi TaxID=196109 RepID=A0A136IY35_9PEZI|nr:hypothetical protein Micbo1qcDRAFT_164956 [Microdochium bolleyi]
MTSSIIFYIVVLGLTAVAIYVQVTASSLSLPIPKATTILVIILPWIAAAVDFCNRLTNANNTRRHDNAPSLLHRLARASLPFLQLFQGILTIVLATLLSQTTTSQSPTLDCLLQGRWQQMWAAHDRRRIELVQDTFECCGFNSVKDRAWPRDTCSLLYGRNSACRPAWAAALQTSSRLDFGVCLIVGVMQVYQLFKYLNSHSQWGQHRNGRAYKQLPQNDDNASEVAGANARLLEDVSDEEVEESEWPRLGDEENTGDRRALRGAQNGHQTDYGAAQNGSNSPVVIPSGLGNEADAWR